MMLIYHIWTSDIWPPGALSAGSYARCTKHGQEELPHVQGQGQQPRVPGCYGAGTAKRSYPASEVSGGQETPCVRGQGGGQEELPHVRGQWRPGGDTPPPRSGAAGRSHLSPEARGGDPEEPPQARGQGQRPGGATQEWWLRRRRKA